MTDTFYAHTKAEERKCSATWGEGF